MKTTPNYFPGANATDGSLKVEVYLHAMGISYKRINGEIIFVPQYASVSGTVSMYIIHFEPDNSFIFNTEAEKIPGARRNHEVLRYVNILNGLSHYGHFYLCPKCDSPHFRFVQKTAVRDLSDEVIHESMDTASFRLLDSIGPINLIVNKGKTAEEAIKELPSSQTMFRNPMGVTNENL